MEEEMYIRLLADHIDYPYWRNHTLRPIDVILNPELYPDIYNKIMDTDLSFPIDIVINGKKIEIRDEISLLRLIKSWIIVKHKVKVRKFPM